MPESKSRTTTPGGTGRLGETTVARIGFGVMQLERRAPNREAALAILTRPPTPGSTTLTPRRSTGIATS